MKCFLKIKKILNFSVFLKCGIYMKETLYVNVNFKRIKENIIWAKGYNGGKKRKFFSLLYIQ